MTRGDWFAAWITAMLSMAIHAAEAPARVVSAGGAVTEWIVAIGGEGQLVGVDSTSRHPAQVTALPSVGYQRQLSAEGLLALHPQLLIGSEEMGPPAVLAQLRQAGVPVVILAEGIDHATLAANVRRLGSLLGHADQAERALHAFDQRLAQVQHDQAGAPISTNAPGVLLLLGGIGERPLVAGRDTVGDWLLHQAGLRNLATHSGYRALAEEVLAGLDPQGLVLADRRGDQALARRSLLSQSPALAASRALREDHLLLIDPTLLVGGIGPRLPDAVAQVAKAFAHP